MGSAVVFSLLLVVSGFAVFAAAQASSAPSIASGSTGAIRSYGPPQYSVYDYTNATQNAIYRNNSKMLANPVFRGWLEAHHVNVSWLAPYVTMTKIGVNPYDFSQGNVTVNGTAYQIYAYLLPNGTAISFWYNGNVTHIFTYLAVPGLSNNAAEEHYVSLSTSENANTECGVGHQVEGSTSSYSNQVLNGATYKSEVFSVLSSPSNCGSSLCWYWGNWIGVSNYDWTSPLPSEPYFFKR